MKGLPNLAWSDIHFVLWMNNVLHNLIMFVPFLEYPVKKWIKIILNIGT